MKKSIILIIVLFVGFAGSQCTKNENRPDLKLSFQSSVNDINTAISKISGTKGYQLMSMSGDAAKSEDSFKDSITLPLIAGIYDYQPNPVPRNHYYFPYRLFKKTGESEKMIVNLPERMVFHPKYLHYYSPKDSVLKNNFTVTASDYHLYYTWWKSYDYKLSAGFTLDSEYVGDLDVSSSAHSFIDNFYSSKFTFTGGYNVSTEWQTGDTTVSSFALLKDKDVLLKETRVFIWDDFHRGEKQYILTIGNIDIKRATNIDSIQVYLDGVLQKEAAAVIKDGADTTGSICHKRDILLTFNDGTTAKLSEKIDPALTKLRTLIDSMHSMYFAKNIVDYIAVSIYYNTR
ncbi:MAG: hypothetical protein LLG13_15695 [Bacteroidales bacterium]|nr:hypothetical protein [Bacteroidales bacterium]